MGGQLPCPGPTACAPECILRDKHATDTLGREAVVLTRSAGAVLPPSRASFLPSLLPASSGTSPELHESRASSSILLSILAALSGPAPAKTPTEAFSSLLQAQAAGKVL